MSEKQPSEFEQQAREAFKLAAAKLPVRTTFVNRTVM